MRLAAKVVFGLVVLLAFAGYALNVHFTYVGYHRRRLPSGDVYYGSWFKGKRTGNGTLVVNKSKCTYRGEFVDNKIQGVGTWDCKSSFYSGEWRDGTFHGQGTLLWDKMKYSGQFANGQFEGRGQLDSSDSYTGNYTGDFVAGQKHGYGLIRMELGSIWKGWFVKGNKDHQRCSYSVWAQTRSYSVGGNDECSQRWEGRVKELESRMWASPDRKVRNQHVEALFYYPDCVCDCDIPAWECVPQGSPLGSARFVPDPEELAAEAEENRRKAEQLKQVLGAFGEKQD